MDHANNRQAGMKQRVCRANPRNFIVSDPNGTWVEKRVLVYERRN